jgi:hypothetical protein
VVLTHWIANPSAFRQTTLNQLSTQRRNLITIYGLMSRIAWSLNLPQAKFLRCSQFVDRLLERLSKGVIAVASSLLAWAG